jgi:hypothetical protein
VFSIFVLADIVQFFLLAGSGTEPAGSAEIVEWTGDPHAQAGSSRPNRASAKRAPAQVRIPFAARTYRFTAFAETHLGRTEPPDSATENNAGHSSFFARNSPSPVPIRLCPSSKTPRKRTSFWDGRGLRVRSLCNRRTDTGTQEL